MRYLWLTAYADIIESLRARWFLVYSTVFGGLIVILFAFGLAESRVMGFTGLSRLLITYIQLSMAMLPIFVLIGFCQGPPTCAPSVRQRLAPLTGAGLV